MVQEVKNQNLGGWKIFRNLTYVLICSIYSINKLIVPFCVGKAGKQFVIRLHPSLSEGTFKPQRFSPTRNNVRRRWFKGEEGVADDTDGEIKSPGYIC